MKTIKQVLKTLGKVLLGIIVFFVLYGAIIFTLSRITVNERDNDKAQDVAIYLKTNGVHSDIVVPLKTGMKDWSTMIKPKNTISNDATMQYVAFGWGDKGFYLNTPEWADLKVSTALNAALYLGTTAMHTTFYKTMREDETCVKINISKAEYAKLTAYIEKGFQYDSAGNPILIDTRTYNDDDSFYEANGKYSLFYTCNAWTNNALKSADLKAAAWTLTDTGIFCHYQ